MIKIILADDHRLFLQSVSRLLNRYKNFEVIAEFGAGDQVLRYLENTNSIPDVLVTDIRMPELNGIELVSIVSKKFPSIKCIMLSMFDSSLSINEAFENGASAYLDKGASPDILIQAINEVYEKGKFNPDKANKKTLEVLNQKFYYSENYQKNTPEFTDEEHRVLILICDEFSNSQIAKIIGKSLRTVENIRQRVMEKSESTSVAGLVKFAIRHEIYNLKK